MNTVTLNGKSSRLIQGLLIQELPPISKPMIRTRTEEIDGRDGDIVTKLGYSAYDKDITIGLHGNFDINEVIAFFNTEGEVIFSNEPDKFYRYKILDQIDFERLVRFRTATVTFHVQPFKYSVTEHTKYFTSAENILMPPDGVTVSKGLTSTRSDGTIHVEGTSTGTYADCMVRQDVVIPAGTYVLKVDKAPPCQFRLLLRLQTKSKTAWMPRGSTEFEFTTDEDSTYFYYYLGTDEGTEYNFDITPVVTGEGGQVITNAEIENHGNYFSRPTITIVGEGMCNLSLNGYQMFAIDLGDEMSAITIDTENMNAYRNGVLANRQVTGDYNNFMLKVGMNEITWNGNVDYVIISHYSRWL